MSGDGKTRSPSDLGGRVRIAAARIGRQRDAARRLGIALSTLGSWIAGRTEPGASDMARLSQAAGVSLDWLLTGREMPRDGDGAAKSHLSAIDGNLLARIQAEIADVYVEMGIAPSPAGLAAAAAQEYNKIVESAANPGERLVLVKMVRANIRDALGRDGVRFRLPD